MTRVAAVLVRQSMAGAAPPGVESSRWLEAVAEDTYEVVAGLDFVTPVLVTSVPGLDENRLLAEAGSEAVGASLADSAGAAEAAGVTGTPWFELGPTGGDLHRLEVSSLGPGGCDDQRVPDHRGLLTFRCCQGS